MKLLYVHDRFGALAGAEANVIATAIELKKRGHEVGILHGRGTGNEESLWEQTFNHRCLLPDRAKLRSLLENFHQFQPDVVYVHKTSDVDILAALLSSKRPLVRMVHDHDIYCMRSYRYGLFSRRICTRPVSPYCVFPCGAFLVRTREGEYPLRWNSFASKKKEVALNQQFNRMIVVSHYMKEQLLLNGFDARRIEIHPPVPHPGGGNIRSTFSDRNLVLYAGQITRGKGVDVLLESLALVRTHFECVIVGDGPYRPYCERLSKRLGLQHRVTFKGFVPQEELNDYYRECSTMVIGSLWPEPIATIGLEVMRYALPVVAFDAGGIKDWLTDGYNGYLVPWMDKIAFASRVERLLNDKDLARSLGKHGFDRASRDYDFGEYLGNLERMFAQVMAEGPIISDTQFV
jgi:glycosyltransferase involved in cell wall biosynthesis